MTQFTQQDVDALCERYSISNDEALLPTPDEMLIDFVESYCYDGSYGTLFVKAGVLYENHCSHCSCYGCEEQWGPEETTLAAIALRPDGFRGTPIDEVIRLARAAGYTGN